MRKTGKQEKPAHAIAHAKHARTLRFLGLFLVRVPICTICPLVGPLQTHLKQKDAKETKSEMPVQHSSYTEH